MAGWVCAGCTTTYSVGAPRCPHCGHTEYTEQGAAMPKITVHGGPSIAGASVVGGAWSDASTPDEWPDLDKASSEEAPSGASPDASPEESEAVVEEPKPKTTRRTRSRS